MNPLSFVTQTSPFAGRPDIAPRRAGDDAHQIDDSRQALRGSDTVEFSAQARSVSAAPEEAPVRQDLVNRVRAEIAAGTYETPTKYLAALTKALGNIDASS